MSVANSISIRRAEERDLAALGHLGASLMRIHHDFNSRRFMSPGDTPDVGYANFLNDQMTNPDMLVLVAERTNGAEPPEVVGYVYAAVEPESFKELRARAGYIHDLLVSDDVRGMGAGARLIDAAVDWLRTKQVPRVLLWTAAPNARARKLFEAHGFEPTMVEMTREL